MRSTPLPRAGTRVLVHFTGTIVNHPGIGGVGAVSPDGYNGLVRRLDGTETVTQVIDFGTRAATGMSPRELDVLRLVAEGLTNPGIAVVLGLSVDTVKTHVKHLLKQFHTDSRITLVVKALQTKVLKLGELCLPDSPAGSGVPGLSALTDHEARLLPLLAAAMPDKAIADRLHYSESTVAQLVTSIRAKWHVGSRTELVALAYQQRSPGGA